MTLECTLVSGPRSSRFAEPLEVTIRFSPGCSGSELQEALSNKYGTDTLTVAGSPISEMFPGIPPLINGAVLVDCGDPEPQNDRGIDQSPAGLMLAVHCGPGAGTVTALRRGSYNIGRSGADVVIADAELSREHARLEVSDTAVTILDLGSANGTTVDGKRVKRSTVSTGSSIRCGNTIFSVILGPAVEPAQDGQAPGSDVSEPLLIRRQTEAWNRSALILTAGIPLVIGVALALITGMWMFLAFTAVSAVSVLAPLATGRRQRRELRARMKNDDGVRLLPLRTFCFGTLPMNFRRPPSLLKLTASGFAWDWPPRLPISGSILSTPIFSHQCCTLFRSGFLPPSL
jgi:S-DNA-T family DNA segregation ATPase FtsK/SpoIIIE